jgi:hypothetical protein
MKVELLPAASTDPIRFTSTNIPTSLGAYGFQLTIVRPLYKSFPSRFQSSVSGLFTSHRNIVDLPVTTSSQWNVTVLSQDPKVLYIQDFLSPDECHSYIEWAKMRNGNMTRSNPPSVSLDTTRLWPLPIICFLAGIPSSIRFMRYSPPVMDVSWVLDLVRAILPAISIASVASAVLCLFILTLVRMISDNTSRTSDALSLNSEQDCEFIRPLVERASFITNHPWSHWEAPVVTKYRTGARFMSHNDASPKKGFEWSNMGGQRVVTVITYLNTCVNGGGTKFDTLGFTVQPKQGSTLIFFPADRNTLLADDRTIHQSLPAVEEKWIVQLFGRIDRVPTPLGIPDAFQYE